MSGGNRWRLYVFMGRFYQYRRFNLSTPSDGVGKSIIGGELIHYLIIEYGDLSCQYLSLALSCHIGRAANRECRQQIKVVLDIQVS